MRTLSRRSTPKNRSLADGQPQGGCVSKPRVGAERPPRVAASGRPQPQRGSGPWFRRQPTTPSLGALASNVPTAGDNTSFSEILRWTNVYHGYILLSLVAFMTTYRPTPASLAPDRRRPLRQGTPLIPLSLPCSRPSPPLGWLAHPGRSSLIKANKGKTIRRPRKAP